MEARYSRERPPQIHFPLKFQLSLIVSLIAALAASSPAWISFSATLRAVGQGAANSLEPASWSDRLVAAAYGLSGWTGATITRSGLIFLGWFLFLLAVTTILGWAATRRKIDLARRVILGASSLLALVVGGQGIFRAVQLGQTEIRDIRLLAPVALIETARKNGGRVFTTPSMVSDVAALAPDLVGETPIKLRETMIASPVRWREEDRETPASAVIIAGLVTEAVPLTEHLLASPDWRLAQVDNHGLLFLRGKGPSFSPPPAEKLGGGIPPDQRGFFLARTALNYQQADLKTAARALMNTALESAPDDPRVLVCGASLAASQGQWERARALAEKALKRDPTSQQGSYLLALSLLETGATERASDLAHELVRKNPRDRSLLFLHARTARAANDPSAEIESLEKLVSLSESVGLPTGRIRIYLGQAWAQRGFPVQALNSYRAALQGGLTPGEATDVREAIKTIEENRLPASP